MILHIRGETCGEILQIVLAKGNSSLQRSHKPNMLRFIRQGLMIISYQCGQKVSKLDSQSGKAVRQLLQGSG